MKKEEVDAHVRRVVDKLIEQMQENLGEWIAPWHNGFLEPKNAITHHLFSGMNATLLWASTLDNTFQSDEWATLKQWNTKKAKVKIRSKGTRLFRPIYAKKNNPSDEDYIIYFKPYTVFNADQVNNYNSAHPDLFADNMPIDPSADKFIASCKANITHGNTDAFYRVHEDKIYLPFPTNFVDSSHGSKKHNYYATAIHELIHWSGHDTRMKRNLANNSTEQYAYEELVAELGAAIICTRLENTITPRTDHAAYLKSWIKHLKNDFHYLFKAVDDAKKAVHFLYELTGIENADVDCEDKEFEQLNDSEAVEPEKIILTGFVSTLKVSTCCNHCHENYSVTLTRYENLSFCEQCSKPNKHLIEW